MVKPSQLDMRMVREDRTIDRTMLRQLARAAGGDGGNTTVAAGCKISLSMLEKMLAGTYGRIPSKRKRESICGYFKVAEDVLFPLVGASERKTG